MTDRTAWKCPDCGRINAPHIDTCPCSEPDTAPDNDRLDEILDELKKLEAQGFNWRYVPVPYYPPPIYVYPPPQPYRVVPAPTWTPWSPVTISTGGTAPNTNVPYTITSATYTPSTVQ